MDTITKVLLPAMGFLVAIGLAVWKYLYELRQKRAEDRLQRIGNQIRQLYGPLYALVEARAQSWRIFEARHNVNQWDRRAQKMPQEDVAAWRRWMTQEFQATNTRIYQLITENADLFSEQGMPRAFKTFIMHYVQYREIIERWDSGDFNILFSEIAYPDADMADHVKGSFEALKRTQHTLLGHRHELVPEPKTRAGAKSSGSHGSE